MRTQEENKSLEKRLNIGAVFISIIVFLMVLLMRRVKIETGIDFSFLPPFHATVNGLAALTLIGALIAIKKGNIHRHRQLMITAIFLSVLFLTSYVVYHFTTPETPFCKEGTIRLVYFILLVSHIVLAAVILPFILFTFIRAWTFQFDRHKRMARWVYPLWLFVTISGPILYLMLKDCY